MGQHPSKKSSKKRRIEPSSADIHQLPHSDTNTSLGATNEPILNESSESVELCADIWADLPSDIVMEIFSRVDVIDILRLQTLSQKWRELLQSQQLWRTICKKYWPSYPLHTINNYFKFFLKRGGVYFVRSVNHLNRLANMNNEKNPPVNSPTICITNYHELDNGLVLIFEKSPKQYRSKWSKEFWSKTAQSFKDGCNLVLAPKFLEDDESDYILLENSFTNDFTEIFGSTRETADMSEKKIIKIITQVMNAVKNLHDNNIVIGDWSDFSFVFDICSGWFDLKMYDHVRMYSVPPSPGIIRAATFFSPETIMDKAVIQSDFWTLGAVTYTLLIGRPPFFSASLWLEYQAVKKGDYKWPEQSPVTNLAKDFVDKLLVLDPLKRMTLKDAIEHPWITDLNPSTVFLEEAWIEYSGVKQ
jgi:hypothetical protein